jgi:DNA processing protein
MGVSLAWLALSLIPRLGGKLFFTLIDHFGTPEAVLDAPTSALREVRGIGETTAHAIRSIDLPALEAELASWLAQGVQCVGYHDPAYPPLLKRIPDAPPTLFMRGQVQAWQARWHASVSIVGTREPSYEGMTFAMWHAYRRAQVGEVVVSGMALGIDTRAHYGALGAEGGFSVAVLGGGILAPYPTAEKNHGLAEKLLARGVLVCECAPSAPVSSTRLVARNRLISGLSEALVMVESEADGGAMHAVRFAMAQGRAVYAPDLPRSGNRHVLANGGLRL